MRTSALLSRLAAALAVAVCCLGVPAEAVVVWNLPPALTQHLSPLEHACLYGDVAAAQKALNEENINKRRALGWTPLHYACLYGDRQLVGLLLAHGAEVNVADDSGCTPLLLSATKSDPSLVKLLLDAGADIDAKGDLWAGTLKEQTVYKHAVSPVAMALRRGSDAVAHLLLAQTNRSRRHDQLPTLSEQQAQKLDLSAPIPVPNQDLGNAFVGLSQSMLPDAEDDCNVPETVAAMNQASVGSTPVVSALPQGYVHVGGYSYAAVYLTLCVAQICLLVWGIAWLVTGLFNIKRDRQYARRRLGWGCALIALVFLLPIACNWLQSW